MARAAPRQMQATHAEAAGSETTHALVGDGHTRQSRCLSWAAGDSCSARGCGCWGAGGGVGRREGVEVKGRVDASLALGLADDGDGDDHGRHDRNRCCLKEGRDAAPGK